MQKFFIFVVSVLPCCLAFFSDFDMHSMENDRNDGGRIIGGHITQIENHPYQISLLYKGRHICGGSIIDKEWILTAAHCLRRNPRYYSVRTSSSTLRDFDGDTHDVSEIIMHESYDSDSPDFDVGLIRLSHDLEYNEKTTPATLASATDRYRAGTMATVTGWGVFDDDDGRVSDHLREVEVPLVAASKCLKLYDNRLITHRMICAGYVFEGGKDACSGDSGGPMVQDGALIGIVSWGYGCASPTHPGVYVRVAAFRDWIHEKTGV